MEFLAGKDCSGIASIGPILYHTFLQFQPMKLVLLYSAVAILLGRNSAGVCLKCRVGAQPHQTTLATTTRNNPPSRRNFGLEMTVLVSHQLALSYA